MHHLPSVNGSGGHCTTVPWTLVTTTDTNKSCLDVPLSPKGTVSEQTKKLGEVGAYCRQKSQEMFKSYHAM